MNHLVPCYERNLGSRPQDKILPQQKSSTPPRATVAGLQEFLSYATAESRAIHRTRPSICQSQTDSSTTGIANGQSNSPQLEFSMCYDAQRGNLQVCLLQITNVASPKCRLKVILGDKVLTSKFARQCEDTLTFDDILEFSQISLPEVTKYTLYLQTYTYNTLSVPSFIGSVWLPLNDADMYGSCLTRAIDKNCKQIMEIKTSRGEVEIELSLSADQKSLKGTLLRACNLCKMDFWGSSDPFTKLHLFYKENRLTKWHSTVKKNTLNPVYNEPFSFNIDGKDVNELSLNIIVKDYDVIGQNDMIGCALIGAASPCESGRSQWTAVVKTPGVVTTCRHTLSII